MAQNSRFPLSPDQLLPSLDDSDPAQYRRSHEEAIAYLTGQIAAGNPAAEAAWTAVFERLGNLYYASDTPALLRLATQMADLPLTTAAARHTRRYFQAVAAFRQDFYEAARDAFDDLLAAPDLPIALRARALNGRAVISRLTGRLEEAMSGYRASLTLWQQLGDPHYQGIVHLNLGIISYGLRRYHDADAHLRQAEQFFRSAGSAVWLRKVQSELGLVQRDLGHWDAALACFDAYVAQSQAVGAAEDVGVGQANRGEVLLFKGDLAAAKVALQTALRLLVSRTYHVDHLLSLGLAYQSEDDLAAAEAHFRQALALAQEIERREIVPHAAYHLGCVLRQRGEDETALHYFEQAAAAIQAARAPLRDESLKISLLGRWQQVYEMLVLHNLTLGRVEDAFAWAERVRARAFAEGLAAPPDGGPPEGGAASAAEIQAALAPGTMLLCYFTTGVLEQDVPLLRAIPPDNPLREHLLLPACTLLFVLTNERLTAHECPLDPNLFATQSPRGQTAQRFWQTAVIQRLRQTLLPTSRPLLAAGAARLVVIPHGPLHRVPFTALLHEPGGPTISYAPSGTIFAAQQRRLMAGVGCLAVGYNSEVGDGRSLRYTEAEVQQVARLLGGQAWTGSEAKKGRLRQAAAHCRWLHIACHGWFDDADPLASYLETGDGERLTARDVLADWALQAELVTLSACETGVSHILRGDEPMGLVRAFLSAGARAVLVTQWPVDDLATFLLMGRFYHWVQSAADLGAILHQAQSWLQQLTASEAAAVLAQSAIEAPPDWARLPGGATPYAAPEYWAGFLLVGSSAV
ncbi:MAG: CHAT domain-containing protein [Chloroflexi bacterium]|nr:CHAT domain-containing protein [Chloroflexota bacterium]